MSFLHDCDLVGCEANQLRDNNTNNLCDLYGLFGFKQLICEPTRVTLTTSSIIDHIATTNARNIMGSGANKVSLSDHYLVYCIRKFNGAVEKGHKMIKTRKMKNFSEESYGSKCSQRPMTLISWSITGPAPDWKLCCAPAIYCPRTHLRAFAYWPRKIP